MKIKQLRKIIYPMFPDKYSAIIDQCYTSREIGLVVSTLQMAAKDIMDAQLARAAHDGETKSLLNLMEDRCDRLEERLRTAGPPVAVVRNGEEPHEEVLLVEITEVGEGPHKFKNKIGLIKAVREVSNIGLAEAKDLVEDVMERHLRRSVFKGPVSKAAIAARVLGAAGGVTERKEAI